MRLISAFSGLAALAFASASTAAPVTVSFSNEFQTSLHERYGEREGEYLRERVVEAIGQELAERGVSDAGIAIEVAVVDADPNRPTLQQAADQPGLDMLRSISVGGAELTAVLRSANGDVLEEVRHRRYNHSISEVQALGTWSAANFAIRQFARKVADAYVEHAR